MAGQEVRAFNFAVGDTAALVGPSRGRLQGVLVNAAAAAAFTIRSGSATGEILLDLTLPGAPYNYCSKREYCTTWSLAVGSTQES